MAIGPVAKAALMFAAGWALFSNRAAAQTPPNQGGGFTPSTTPNPIDNGFQPVQPTHTTEPTTTSDHGGTQPTAPNLAADIKTTVGDVVGVIGGITGGIVTVVGGVKAAATALGIGTSATATATGAAGAATAGGGGGGALATAVVPGATSSVATTTHTATTALATGGAGGGGGGGTSSGGAAAASSGSTAPASISISGAGLFAIVLVVYIIAMTIMDAAIRAGKNFQFRISALFANARDMHAFEADLFEKFKANNNMLRGFSLLSVRDIRLDVKYDERGRNDEYVRQGWRTIYVAGPPAPGSQPWMGGDSVNTALLRVQKQIRRIALEYLDCRHYLGTNMGSRWGQINVPVSGVLGNDFLLNHMYDSIEPGYGGLNQIPLLDGVTKYTAEYGGNTGRAPGTEGDVLPPPPQMVALDATPDSSFLSFTNGTEFLKAARFKALLEAMAVIANDPQIQVVFDPAPYAAKVLWAMGLPNDKAYIKPDYRPPGYTGPQQQFWSWCILTQPSFFGVAAALDVVAFRQLQGASQWAAANYPTWKINTQHVVPGSRMLDPWWELG